MTITQTAPPPGADTQVNTPNSTAAVFSAERPQQQPQTTTDGKPPVWVKTVIIGTGFAGIAMGAQLRRNGDESFVMLDRGSEVGGTWRDNTYPGVACDVPSHVYSFSFRPNPNWSAFFAPGAEIQQYVRDTVEAEGLTPHLKLNHEVLSARWDATQNHWVTHTSQGDFVSQYLITGTGHLADAHLPEIPGLDEFQGITMHTAAWDHSVDLEGLRIAVVGTGASAIQVIPQLAKVASSLVVFQRTPAWVIPRPEHTFTEVEKRIFQRNPKALRKYRAQVFWTMENGYAARRGVPAYLQETKAMALAHLENSVTDPALRAKLTPDYEPGCKRLLLSNNYYPALTLDTTTLEDSALQCIENNQLVAASGNRYEVDVIVFATGFEATQPPFAEIIFDGQGASLADHWDTGMQAMDSTTMAGFPNLFMINGPNTSLGHNSIVYIIEAQVDYILGAMDYLRRHNHTVCTPKPEEQARYVQQLQDAAQDTVWMQGSCSSWYRDPRSGNLTLIWPGFGHEFRSANATFAPEKYLFDPTQPKDSAASA